ncbi:hypothetical protein CEV34_3560 [Brucella pseudogrignonensis]|uniref:Uncharacterized protein n=1 Tax=Brucella pseudogrignonensis TaxID=419475 RepID=A0A256G9D7_9HYPH|nr:hypothetical protein CEV34_3560 [Brucella pseudogrignonensis]
MVISITFDAQAACGIAPPMTAWLASKSNAPVLKFPFRFQSSQRC